MNIRDKKINYKIIKNILYVFGILVILYYGYLLYDSCAYIGNLISSGEISLSKNFAKVIQYIMTQTFSYLFYGVALLMFGKFISSYVEDNKSHVAK